MLLKICYIQARLLTNKYKVHVYMRNNETHNCHNLMFVIWKICYQVKYYQLIIITLRLYIYIYLYYFYVCIYTKIFLEMFNKKILQCECLSMIFFQPSYFYFKCRGRGEEVSIESNINELRSYDFMKFS